MKTFAILLGVVAAEQCYVCKSTLLAAPSSSAEHPEPYPDNGAAHDCFKPDSTDKSDYNGEYGKPSIEDCTEGCIAIAYSINYYNGQYYEYTIHRGCQENFSHGLNFTVDDCTINWSSGKPSEPWCDIDLTKNNYGNYGTIKAKYVTESADTTKSDITSNDQAGLTWNTKTGINCYQEDTFKENSSKLTAPSELKRCADIFARSCYSTVSQFDGEDDNGDVQQYAYAKRGCSTAVAPIDDDVNTSIKFHHPIPGTVANGTMEVKYCNTDNCNNYVPLWTTSNALLVGISTLLATFVVLL